MTSPRSHRNKTRVQAALLSLLGLSIYAISVGRTWRYLDAMRLLVDDWLLTPGQVAAPSPELTRYGREVIETSALGSSPHVAWSDAPEQGRPR